MCVKASYLSLIPPKVTSKVTGRAGFARFRVGSARKAKAGRGKRLGRCVSVSSICRQFYALPAPKSETLRVHSSTAVTFGGVLPVL